MKNPSGFSLCVNCGWPYWKTINNGNCSASYYAVHKGYDIPLQKVVQVFVQHYQ
jgi:hypothetical protein